VVAPAGTDLNQFEAMLSAELQGFGYEFSSVRLSRLAERLSPSSKGRPGSAEFERTTRLMKAGDDVRETGGVGDELALAAAAFIGQSRIVDASGLLPFTARAHLIRSLKHPAEVFALRRIYGAGFFLLGVLTSERQRRDFLRRRRGCSREEVDELMKIDHHEGLELGQQTSKTFHLADAFVPIDDVAPLRRVMNLIFGAPHETPTRDEHAMFLAFAAALRSGDLSRQVGAVVLSKDGDVLSVGANDVPRAGGGLYWPGPGDQRDHVKGQDSNEAERDLIIGEILDLVRPSGSDPRRWKVRGRKILRAHDAKILSITEYGRPVHAEMEALMSAARCGASPRDGTLFTTTFPCHNCAKHIVASGIRRVVYVEPYPKSKAPELYKDSIRLGRSKNGHPKVFLEPFQGVGPRRFFDLFSVDLGSGYPVKRKVAGGAARTDWKPSNAIVRVPLQPGTYLTREAFAVRELRKRLNGGGRTR